LGVSRKVVENLDDRIVSRLLGRHGVYIPNALDFERFVRDGTDKAAKRLELGIPAQGPLVGSIGRLTAQKGYHLFLQAIPGVLQNIPDAHFVLVGSGEMDDPLRRQAEESGIADHVTFAGSRSDIEDIFGTLDLFVSSSLWEGLPTVILESIAAGVPVVGTLVSGTIELIQNGESGLLVEAGNPEALATAIVTALQDPVTTRNRAERAFTYISSRYAISAVTDEYEELYQRLLAG
jgi:glycosyltransferase involved in cell wall biosynthesis